MQVSRKPRAILEVGRALAGIGEALKQEIAWGALVAAQATGAYGDLRAGAMFEFN